MKLTCASNCLNRIVGPTWCPLNHQFAWLRFKSLNWILYPIYFSSDASVVQCYIIKINYFNGFSSVRAFQRYIICNFSLPFDPFSIFDLFFCSKSDQQQNISHQQGEKGFLTLWGPVAVKEMREEQRREIVRFGWTWHTWSGPTCHV
jgi:hypothetical protein